MWIDPVYNAVNLYTGIYNAIPYSIRAIISLCLILYIIPSVIRMFWSMR